MANKKYYAVRVGRTTGIFDNWDECKASVDGFSGALYKGFDNIPDAYSYMGWEGKQLDIFSMQPSLSSGDDLSYLKEDTIDTDRPYSSAVKAVAYVDGSFNAETKVFGYGMVMFYKDEETHFKHSYVDEELADMRNVAGEIFGSMAAMKFALEHGVKYLTIYYDYMGIEKWCTGEWKANKPGTRDYKKYFDSVKLKVSVSFEKVKGHSGDKYNDLADKLAKEACGVE